MPEIVPPTLQSNEFPQLNEHQQLEYLLGNPPSWMMRFGITVFALVFVFLLALSWFIHYPDVVDAKAVITTSPPPIRIMAPSGGRIAVLLVSNNAFVHQRQVLAVLDNTADWHDVLQLETWLASQPDLPIGQLPDSLQLGALQPEFSTFSQHWKDLQFFLRHHGAEERIGYLKSQMVHLLALHSNLLAQQHIQEQEFALIERDYHRQQSLLNDRVIAQKELEQSETVYLQHKRTLETTKASILQHAMQAKQLESQIGELTLSKGEQAQDKTLSLAEDRHRLLSAIAAWKQTFLITAPIDGQVSFTKIWSVQQHIGAGEEVMAVVPGASAVSVRQVVVGKASLSAAAAAKVKEGHRALIRIEGYPAQEFGALEAVVANLSLMPNEETYQFDLLFEQDSLVSTYGKTPSLRQEIPAQVRIITEDRRVMERIFDRLGSLLQLQ